MDEGFNHLDKIFEQIVEKALQSKTLIAFVSTQIPMKGKDTKDTFIPIRIQKIIFQVVTQLFFQGFFQKYLMMDSFSIEYSLFFTREEEYDKLFNRIAYEEKLSSEIYILFSQDSKISEYFDKLSILDIQDYYIHHIQTSLLFTMNSKNSMIDANFVRSSRRRKEGGVYYTTKTIAERMVYDAFKNLGVQIDEILEKKIQNEKNPSILMMNEAQEHELIKNISELMEKCLNLTICDPALGTGVFLLESLDLLCQIHLKLINLRDFYFKIMIHLKSLQLNSPISEIHNEKFGFTFFEEHNLDQIQNWKQYILKNLLFGIDIDGNAIFVAINLLLVDFNRKYPSQIIYPFELQTHFFIGDAVISPNISPFNEKFQSQIDRLKSSIYSFYFEYLNLATNFRIFISSQKPTLSENESLFQISNYVKKSIENFQSLDHLTKILLEYGYENKLFIKFPGNDSNYLAFSWILHFPTIFLPHKYNPRKNFGFSHIITNPPWEMIQLNDAEFFSHYDLDYRNSDLSEKRKKKAILLKSSLIRDEYSQYSQEIQWKIQFWSKNTKSQGENKFNLYKLYLERILDLIAFDGIISIITPAGILGEERANPLRAVLIQRCEILSIIPIFSGKAIFSNITAGQPLVITTCLNGHPTQILKYFPFNIELPSKKSLQFPLNLPLSVLQNLGSHFPTAKRLKIPSIGFPLIYDSEEITLFQILAHCPTIGQGWGINVKRELNRTDDEKNGIIQPRPSPIPVLEGKHLSFYGYSLKTIKYFITESCDYVKLKPIFQYRRIVWRNVSNINLRRRLFVAIIPKGIATVNSINYLEPYYQQNNQRVFLTDDELIYLMAMLGSLVAEFWIRLFSSNNNLNQYLIQNLPVPRYDHQNLIHQKIVREFRKNILVFSQWADEMVTIGKNMKKKIALELYYQNYLAQIDALTLLAYHISSSQLPIIFQRFPKINSTFFTLVQSFYSSEISLDV